MIKPIVFNYPIERQYDLNVKLHELLLTHSTERLGGFKKKGKRLQGGRRTPWDLHRQGVKEFDELAGWVKSILPRVASYFARLKKGEKCSFLVEALEITHMWGVIYDKGDSVYPHNHFPFSVSFGYYVCTPQGCSPLKIENKKINIQAGDCIFFSGPTWHSVDPEPVGGRSMIAGNILYSDSKIDESFTRLKK